LHELIDDGYFIGNSTAIRRLLDAQTASGAGGVFSLVGLINEIGDCEDLFTRGNVLAARDLDYDYAPARFRAYAEAENKGTVAISPIGWFGSRYWHGVMDELCGVVPENRARSDSPNKGRMKTLAMELAEKGRSIREWTNKFIAHAASPESRKGILPQSQSVSLAKLWLAERMIVRSASFISAKFVTGENLAALANPWFDLFAFLNRPFVDPNAIGTMQREWEKHKREIHACKDWFWDQPLINERDNWEEPIG
jgi:hypothetical protein